MKQYHVLYGLRGNGSDAKNGVLIVTPEGATIVDAETPKTQFKVDRWKLNRFPWKSPANWFITTIRSTLGKSKRSSFYVWDRGSRDYVSAAAA